MIPPLRVSRTGALVPVLTTLLTMAGQQSVNPLWAAMKVASSWLLAYMLVLTARAVTVRAAGLLYPAWSRRHPLPLLPAPASPRGWCPPMHLDEPHPAAQVPTAQGKETG
jgi:hypothetical protein